jgi:endonuclease G, mitochondrial
MSTAIYMNKIHLLLIVLISLGLARNVSAQYIYFYPTSTTKKIIAHKYYVLSYSVKDKQAEWVAYMMTRQHVLDGKIERTNNFRPDPLIKKHKASAQLEDYKGSGHDRGHIAPAGDMKFDSIAMSESFFLSNMSPQLPDFNRGIWQRVEQQVRNWAQEYDSLYIATAGTLKYSQGTIGKSKVTVPKYFYKVILDYKKTEKKAIAFLLANEKGTKRLREYTVSIDSVEKITGIDFFPVLPDSIENRLESRIDTTLWKWDVSSEPRKYGDETKKDYSESEISIAAAEAMDYVGQKVNVKGTIAQISRTSKAIYLNMGGKYPDHTFAGQIYFENFGLFKDIDSYLDKKVAITGRVKDVKGKPVIIVDSPEQIRMK